MNIKKIASGRGNLYSIPLDKIEIEDGFNVRSDYGDIPELAADIAQNGVLNPLTVRMTGERLVLSDGHRRLAAVKYAVANLGAAITDVPCIMERKGTGEDDRVAYSKRE